MEFRLRQTAEMLEGIAREMREAADRLDYLFKYCCRLEKELGEALHLPKRDKNVTRKYLD